jgi:hypothetical protein
MPALSFAYDLDLQMSIAYLSSRMYLRLMCVNSLVLPFCVSPTCVPLSMLARANPNVPEVDNLRTQRVRQLTDAFLLLLSNMPVSMLARRPFSWNVPQVEKPPYSTRASTH